VRCEPALAGRPLVVVQGTPPATRVVEANAAARERSVAAGMTEAHARALCPELVRRPFVEARLASAQHALLTGALGVSPRVEDAGRGLRGDSEPRATRRGRARGGSAAGAF